MYLYVSFYVCYIYTICYYFQPKSHLWLKSSYWNSTHTLELRIWDTKDKVGTRARFDRHNMICYYFQPYSHLWLKSCYWNSTHIHWSWGSGIPRTRSAQGQDLIDIIWYAIIFSHTVTVTKELLLKLYTHTLELRIWDTKDKVGTRARFDRHNMICYYFQPYSHCN